MLENSSFDKTPSIFNSETLQHIRDVTEMNRKCVQNRSKYKCRNLERKVHRVSG